MAPISTARPGSGRPWPDPAAGPIDSEVDRVWTVGELARLAGVTVRTLHHYDRIGLVRPGLRSPAGYRGYTSGDLDRLQRVLGYRELGFSLDEIGRLLDDPDLDPMQHLSRQHQLVLARLHRLSEVAAVLERTMEAYRMGLRLTPEEMLEVFGDEDATQHSAEAEERWGDTDAWRESHRRTAGYTKDDWLRLRTEADEINQRFVAAMVAGEPASGARAIAAARAHRAYLSRWFYDCSPQMHRGLAEMYVADPRFTATFEKVAPGLAQYVRDAIVAEADQAEADQAEADRGRG